MKAKPEFLAEYRISEAAFEATAIDWNALEAIYSDYTQRVEDVQAVADSVEKIIRNCKSVHSIRSRVKSADHLIEKIIRKKIEDASYEVPTLENYKTKVTDLAGVRALHLYKDEWKPINDLIISKWSPLEVVAKVREGDVLSSFEEASIKTEPQKAGYRSIHYLLPVSVTKDQFIVELQVRTLIEEAWSEIDHQVRYPYDQKNDLLLGYLLLFNRIAGGADEMGSYLRTLKGGLDAKEADFNQQIASHKSEIANLKSELSKLSNDVKGKEALEERVKELEKFAPRNPLSADTSSMLFRDSKYFHGIDRATFDAIRIPSASGLMAGIAEPFSGSKAWTALEMERERREKDLLLNKELLVRSDITGQDINKLGGNV